MKTKTLFTGTTVLIMLLTCLFTFGACGKSYDYGYTPEKEGYLRTQDIRIRDICVVTYENTYYMYGMYTCSEGDDGGYGYYVSEDLQYWQGPYDAFLASDYEEFAGTTSYWAPEVHLYNGKYYLFGSYYSPETGNRGTGIFVSDTPAGPFVPWSDGHITPHEWNCIDGTLYVDDDGQAWLIFVHEWVDEGEGSMCIAKLSDDLKSLESEPTTVFYAKDALWTNNKVTDGPWIYKTKDGTLLMLWSNSDNLDNYAIGIAYSSNGKIDGTWKQKVIPLYSKGTRFAEDGGHGMIFTDLNGNLVLAFHAPGFVYDESYPEEKARFYKLEDTGSSLKITGPLFG